MQSADMSRLPIAALQARQVLDSRGRPTVEVDATLADGSRGRASVPSGASTGAAEAHELRDGDKTLYAGFGVLRAVANVNGEIATALRGVDASDQRDVDARLRNLDGTPQLTRLGANATLGVSLAVCRAAASARGQALYERIGELTGVQPLLPLPMTNILSGGLHASGGMDVQDFLAVPMRAATIGEAIHVIARVRSAATDVMRDRGLSTLLADEGGLSPGCDSVRAALQLMIESIDRAGLRPRDDVSIAIDVAASSLQCDDGRYVFVREGVTRDADAMIVQMSDWLREAPIVSIEDGL
ncbi:MAG TPA: phosphopyruvate hydratase, partial [Casimicrobiaceae bacterium]|nr:phosphopyruvate hydratase [Casimicrobiaceae bacterium]